MGEEIKPTIWDENVDRIIREGTEDEIATLRGTPGVRFETISWGEISRLVTTAKEGGDISVLSNVGRTPKDLRIYRNFKEKVLSRYASLGDYIKVLVFHCDTMKRQEDGRLVAVDLPAAQPQRVWRPSDFPYFLDASLQHHVVWSSMPLDTEELETYIRTNRKGWEYIYWVNPEPLMSIRSVWHAHVVSRRHPPTTPVQKAAHLLLGVKDCIMLNSRHMRTRSNPI